MSERAYSIELKLDGTNLCVSLIEDDGEGGGWEVSGDSVDLKPALSAAFRAGQEDMKRRAVEVARAIKAPASIGRDHGRHHEAGAQSAARAISTLPILDQEPEGEAPR